ncbi:MAG: DUF333 domain-containing protein [Candidatus Altiarchaeales archaeon]|nr:DUF333 domain-containing protein [Candidatus Altiarchaeales archaeon]MBD3416137.1 DUF333 domain-containing protein [Candidatus Altiarchaeales archaeon]
MGCDMIFTMRFLRFIVLSVLVCGCLGGGGGPATTTTLDLSEMIKEQKDAARQNVSQMSIFNQGDCRGPHYVGIEYHRCSRCWSFTFRYDCEVEVGGETMTREHFVNVTFDDGRLRGIEDYEGGLKCISVGDCIPEVAEYNVRYECVNGSCQESAFTDDVSTFCLDRGHRIQMRKHVTGETYLMCVFSNGNECEIRSYYDGRCSPYTDSMTECRGYEPDTLCSSEYNPVCAEVRVGNQTPYTFEAMTFSNPCVACTTESKFRRVIGYKIGVCPPTTTTTIPTKNMTNPEAAYCEAQGYVYKIRKYSSGREYGVCVFSLYDECNAEDFFKGICGPES